MSLQDRLEQKTVGLKRKLFDNQLKLHGHSFPAVRVKETINKYSDSEEVTITSESIECFVAFPAEVPLFRFRNSTSDDKSDTNGIFLFDVLPTEVFTKFEDNLEKGDYLVLKMTDENDNIIKILLKVTETLGAFNKYLVWKKANAAPYNGIISSSVQAVIDAF